MIEALSRGMEAGAWAFGALLIFGLGVLLVVLGIAGLGWAFGDPEGMERPELGDEGKGEREKGKGIAGDTEGMEERDEEGEPVDDLIRHGFAVPPFHGPAGPISLKTVHRTVSRAFDAPKGKAFGGQADPGVRCPKGEGFRKRGSSLF